ncbi:G/T mismatches repair enzyme [uncultured archaeon]|nr:G/T mismatches repair enzyme [uncultured archaeon]
MTKFAEAVLKKLSDKYGSRLHTQLTHSDTTELFVAALLSPQCTDKQVNETTSILFKQFRTFKDYASSDTGTLRRQLKGINFYKTKARHLRAASRRIVDEFGGKVPKTINELMELDGVGRKIANVVLSEGYGINEGIAVDTHVAVTSRRLGLTRSNDPDRIEKDLAKKIPKKDWGKVNGLFIELGRDVCTARKKYCERCVLNRICPSSTI